MVAYRGFQAFDNSLGVPQGQWVGSKMIALNTNQVAGPSSFQPGWDFFIGWRFQGGVAVELDWKHLVQNQFSAAAAAWLQPGATNAGSVLQNTFVTAQVYNFGPEWAGAPQNVTQGDVGATFGIWNAASFMQELYIQRLSTSIRSTPASRSSIPPTRASTACSARAIRLDRRSIPLDDDLRKDQFGNDDGAAAHEQHDLQPHVRLPCRLRARLVSGQHADRGVCVHVRSGRRPPLFRLRQAPSAAFIPLTNSNPQVGSSRSRRIYSIVPGVDGQLGVDWYPWEAIKLHMGYDVNTFFNTIASDQPIDFNLGRVTPQYEHQFLRYFYGFSFGVSFVW